MHRVSCTDIKCCSSEVASLQGRHDMCSEKPQKLIAANRATWFAIIFITFKLYACYIKLPVLKVFYQNRNNWIVYFSIYEQKKLQHLIKSQNKHSGKLDGKE